MRLFEAHGQPDDATLFEVPVPTLLIIGSEDYAYGRSEALHERLSDSERVVIDGAGHACNIEQPARWNAAATEFLRRRTSAFDAVA